MRYFRDFLRTFSRNRRLLFCVFLLLFSGTVLTTAAAVSYNSPDSSDRQVGNYCSTTTHPAQFYNGSVPHVTVQINCFYTETTSVTLRAETVTATTTHYAGPYVETVTSSITLITTSTTTTSTVHSLSAVQSVVFVLVTAGVGIVGLIQIMHRNADIERLTKALKNARSPKSKPSTPPSFDSFSVEVRSGIRRQDDQT